MIVSVRPIIRFGIFFAARVERVRLDERAAEAVDHRIQLREDQRAPECAPCEARCLKRQSNRPRAWSSWPAGSAQSLDIQGNYTNSLPVLGCRTQ